LRRFGDYLFQAAVGALIVLSFAGMVLMLVSAGANTGPNCPGKDPSWIGWCDEAPEAR